MNESAANNLEAPLSDVYQINRIIADTASDAIITIDEDSTMLFVNRAAEKIFGYSHAELLGQSLTMLMPDYLRHVHRSGLQRYLATGQRHISWEAVQLPGRHQSGREIPLELSFGEFTENGRRFFTGIARDITERRRLERRLEVQFQVARILAASDSMTAAAPELLRAIGESVGWEMGQMWGVDRAADVLRYLAVWRPPSVPAADLEEATRSRTFGRGIGLPGRIWAPAKSEWITDIAADTNFPRGPFATKAGLRSAFGLPIMVDHEVSGVMEFFSIDHQTPDQSLLAIMNMIGQQIGNFVERKRAEEERAQTYDREQRARLEIETAIDRMKQVQTVTDVALAHLSMDELLAELLTRVREAMNVDTVAILLLEPEGDELVAWAAKGLEEEVDLGVRIPVGAGFAGKVSASRSPVIINDLDKADVLNPLFKKKGIKSLLGVPLLIEGRVIGVMHVGRLTRYEFTEDDTRLLQLVADRIALAIDNARLFEEERTARLEAQAASPAKDEFPTTISHELRTPLTPIHAGTHLIGNRILTEKEMTHGLSVIEKNSYALKRLINDLLDMSAILSGKMRMEELPVSLEQVVREAVETVRPFADTRNIDLVVTFHDWQNEIVSGDRARLVQVFWNLLHNAIKFSPVGAVVKVEAEADEKETTLCIKDAGLRISADFLPFVFERFRQSDGSKTRSYSGLGLGLALVKSFVEAHNGTVEAESRGIDQGSCFLVKLPRLRAEVETVSVPPEQPQPDSPPDKVHLMIVEDDPHTLQMFLPNLHAPAFPLTASQSPPQTL